MTIFYCYDAYCGWCYGFSPVIKRIEQEYKDQFWFEVLSGGMIPKEHPQRIETMADYISQAYLRVEEITGIKFGQDFLWHVFNPDKSDWIMHSEKSAIALCIFKEIYPELQVSFATDLEYSLKFEGRDLTDDEAYRHLLIKYQVDETDFYGKLHSEEFKEKAHYEFSLCRQLQVTGFPAMLLQASETKFYLLTRGYSSYEDVKARIENILQEIESADAG
jgi:putative protein-disulfide isomerase